MPEAQVSGPRVMANYLSRADRGAEAAELCEPGGAMNLRDNFAERCTCIRQPAVEPYLDGEDFEI